MYWTIYLAVAKHVSVCNLSCLSLIITSIHREYLYILIKLWSSCLLEAVRTNPGYGMARYSNL